MVHLDPALVWALTEVSLTFIWFWWWQAFFRDYGGSDSDGDDDLVTDDGYGVLSDP